MEQDIVLQVEESGARVDRYVAQSIPELSRSMVQKLLEEGRVTVDGRVPKASERVAAGATIVVHLPAPQPTAVVAQDIPLNVVYEDADVLVVDKPAGMVVHPAAGHEDGTLVNALLGRNPDLASIGYEKRPGIVHRLDKDTSGLLVIAKNDRALHELQAQFQTRQVQKAYLALTEGVLDAPQGVIDAPVGRDPQQRKRMTTLHKGGRPAVTEYVVREYFRQNTLVEAHPVTGRTHQIRVHLAAIGHPLVGDPVYGYRRQRLPLKRQFLHAARLRFALPGNGQTVEFSSVLPPDLAGILDLLRKETRNE